MNTTYDETSDFWTVYRDGDKFDMRFLPVGETLRVFGNYRFAHPFCCGHCGCSSFVRHGDEAHQCSACCGRRSLRAGTIWDNSKTPIRTILRGLWDLARDHAFAHPAAIQETFGYSTSHSARRLTRRLQALMAPERSELKPSHMPPVVLPIDSERIRLRKPMAGVMVVMCAGHPHLLAVDENEARRLEQAPRERLMDYDTDAYEELKASHLAEAWDGIQDQLASVYYRAISPETLQGALDEICWRDRVTARIQLHGNQMVPTHELLFQELLALSLTPLTPVPQPARLNPRRRRTKGFTAYTRGHAENMFKRHPVA